MNETPLSLPQSPVQTMTTQTIFYTWRSCSTCRNAQNSLDQLGIKVEERDFFTDPLTREELNNLTDTIGIENIFSWRSPSAKPYRERKDTITRDELIEAMLAEPRLIRRPIVIPPDSDPIIGFKANAYAQL